MSSSSHYSSSASSIASKTNISSSAAPTAYNYAVPSSYPVKNVTSAFKVADTATGTYAIASTTAKAPAKFEGAASTLGMSFSGFMGAGIVGVIAALF